MPKPARTDVAVACRAQEPDRRDPEIAQDLSAKADLAIVARASSEAVLPSRQESRDRNPGGAVAQEYDHAAAGVFEPLQR
jgi:hypothetical protein